MDRNASCLTALLKSVVALRKESVDRNYFHRLYLPLQKLSLSARRAWIEMVEACNYNPVPWVALRKESVDRNYADMMALTAETGRSPQGERG